MTHKETTSREPPDPEPAILVAEDDEINLYVLMAMLRANGHEPLVAIDGIEAVKMALSTRPTVILMDLAMPRLDGLSAARQIREHLSSEDCRIIAVTAHVTDRQQRECRSAGFDAFVGKPFDFDVLSSVIDQALRGRPEWDAGTDDRERAALRRPCASRAG